MNAFYKKLSVLSLLLVILIAFKGTAQSNQYLDFDGVDDFVSVPNGTATIAGSNQITIAGWFYDNQLSYGQGLFGFRGTAG